MVQKKLEPSLEEVVDFVATFQNDEGNQVSISSTTSECYPNREDFYFSCEDYSEGMVLYGISI